MADYELIQVISRVLVVAILLYFWGVASKQLAKDTAVKNWVFWLPIMAGSFFTAVYITTLLVLMVI